MIEYERQITAGYEQTTKIQNAYIAILLKKLGAISEETATTINNEEINRAIAIFDTRGSIPKMGEWKLYCVETTPEGESKG